MENNLFTNEYVSSSRRIYTPSSFARSSLLHLQECGRLTAMRPHVSSRSDLASYLFFLVLDGSGWLLYDGARYELTAGDAVFIDCRRPYSQSSSEDLWTLKWCHFHGPGAPSIYRKFKERGGYDVFRPMAAMCGEAGGCTNSDSAHHPGELPDQSADMGAASFGVYEKLLDDLYQIAGSDSYTRDMQINLKLTELLTYLMEESWHPDGRGAQSAQAAAGQQKVDLLKVKEYVDLHYAEPLTLESLAGDFYLSKHYLARCFKEQFGTTVNGYIQQVRITRAKELLRFTDASIESIAADCGYETNYFGRLFRKTEGTSPGVYRRNWRGKSTLS
ncbi:MAG: AraC family transcriptional regulator [Lachnospiraceae bacterium]|nr:AraC family transcriptional regulator [Lachnospiraceae bacterium]